MDNERHSGHMCQSVRAQFEGDRNLFLVCTHFLSLSIDGDGQSPVVSTILVITDNPSSDYTPQNTRADCAAHC